VCVFSVNYLEASTLPRICSVERRDSATISSTDDVSSSATQRQSSRYIALLLKTPQWLFPLLRLSEI
jgi:hypothetical protein